MDKLSAAEEASVLSATAPRVRHTTELSAVEEASVLSAAAPRVRHTTQKVDIKLDRGKLNTVYILISYLIYFCEYFHFTYSRANYFIMQIDIKNVSHTSELRSVVQRAQSIEWQHLLIYSNKCLQPCTDCNIQNILVICLHL